jgi:hypothetical protein
MNLYRCSPFRSATSLRSTFRQSELTRSGPGTSSVSLNAKKPSSGAHLGGLPPAIPMRCVQSGS